jgi:hypothetical protein
MCTPRGPVRGASGVPRVPYHKLAVGTVEGSDGAGLDAASGGECSAAVRERVLAARERQQARLAGSGLRCNAEWH